jgi:sulfonate transport system ATP-binding protein
VIAHASTGRDARSALSLHNIVMRLGSRTVLDEVTLDVAAGRFVSVVGPSGCGKSTLLNIAAGLLTPDSGRVEMFGEPLAGVNRRASYMFQQDVLLPWKTAFENIELGLVFQRLNRRDARACAQAWLERVGLSGFGNVFPYQLSGGMRKRVALAQCWVVEPEMILMDEPFSALDVHTRLRMEQEILGLWTGSGKTVVFVTHDLEEAISLSDEVVLMSAGPGSRLVGRYAVDLPRPRNLLDIRTDAQFHDAYSRIWNDLRKEVVRSHGDRA